MRPLPAWSIHSRTTRQPFPSAHYLSTLVWAATERSTPRTRESRARRLGHAGLLQPFWEPGLASDPAALGLPDPLSYDEVEPHEG